MKTVTQRVIIYPKDVQRITGKSERYGRVLLQKIKTKYAKEDHQFVTMDEFAKYTGVSVDVILPLIVD